MPAAGRTAATNDTPPVGVSPTRPRCPCPAVRGWRSRSWRSSARREPVDTSDHRCRRSAAAAIRRPGPATPGRGSVFTSSCSVFTSSSLRWTPASTSSVRSPDEPRRLRQNLFVALQKGDAVGSGDGLDAAQVGSDRRLTDDLDRADVAGRPHVRAAAELDRASRFEHADHVAVLVAEERRARRAPRPRPSSSRTPGPACSPVSPHWRCARSRRSARR